MSQNKRSEFSSRLGFIFAAAGSAVGLGNIWGFPTQAASYGGGAFLFTYAILVFVLAYPALMAELIIGRHAKANAVSALRGISGRGQLSQFCASAVGFCAIAVAVIILSFYAIVGGWIVAYVLAFLAKMFGMSNAAEWLMGFSVERNLLFTLVFSVFTLLIVRLGVKNGIENWSKRLMPTLFVLLILLTFYVLSQSGAMQGLSAYLKPDFSKVLDSQLVLNALGQAFFSLSLGVGTMMIYASYVSKQENIVKLGMAVTLIDVGIAFLAGLLILPAMYVAQNLGVEIFSETGALLKEDTLIFSVLPSLFDSMGAIGMLLAVVFFVLLSVAALTSAISLLEVPTAYLQENHAVERSKASLIAFLVVLLLSTLIVFNFGDLFGLAITVSTRYGQPLLGLALCVYAGWVWHRNSLLSEIKQGYQGAEQALFWKIWPFYVRYVCPVVIALIFINSL